MLYAYWIKDGATNSAEINPAQDAIPENCVWIDLHEPDEAEEKLAEQWLGIDIPTRDEMREIEPSSRLYEANGGHYMTLTLVSSMDQSVPTSTAATFVLVGKTLVSIRYADSLAFRVFRDSILRHPHFLQSAADVLTALLDAIIDRLADILEKVQADLDTISKQIFTERVKVSRLDFDHLITQIGQKGDLVSKVRDSLVSTGRIDGYARELEAVRDKRSAAARLIGLGDDIRSLSDHATFLNDKIEFLLNATLGKINIEQSGIIKIFSVVAIVFLPPTLIASIYGMNFEVMPELEWAGGYPTALIAMVVAALFPYLLFRKFGWL